MPTYDYKCTACEHTFEEFQSITAKPIKKCPECGKNKVKRLIGTGGALIFKGSGFYETDYRSDSYQKAAKADKETASAPVADAKPAETKAKPSKKADSKPASKSKSA